MNPPLPVQDSGTDGRGWQDVHAVGAQVALGGAVGGAAVVELCEGRRERVIIQVQALLAVRLESESLSLSP